MGTVAVDQKTDTSILLITLSPSLLVGSRPECSRAYVLDIIYKLFINNIRDFKRSLLSGVGSFEVRPYAVVFPKTSRSNEPRMTTSGSSVSVWFRVPRCIFSQPDYVGI